MTDLPDFGSEEVTGAWGPYGPLSLGAPEPRPPVEPNAAMRAAARQMFELFVALINEGFNERQALVLLGHALKMEDPDDV